jgi:outer membrane protein
VALCAFAAPGKSQTLIEAIEAATRNNPKIRAMSSQVQANRAGLMKTQAGLLPKISGTADIGRSVTDTYVPGSAPSRERSAPRGAGIEIQQTLFDGGKTIANIRSSAHGLDAAYEGARETTQQVIHDTAAAYLDVLRDAEVMRLEKSFLGFLSLQKTTIDKLRRFNEVTNTDVAQVEARLAAAYARVGQAEANFQGSRARYTELVGQEPGSLSLPRPIDALLPKSLEQCLAIASQANPALRAAQSTAKSAREQVNASVADMLPTVRLSGSITDRRGDMNYTGYDRQTAASVVARLSIPIFEGGAIVAGIRESREISNRRQHEADAEFLRVKSVVTASWHQFLAIKTRQSAAEAQARAATVAFKGVRSEFFIGQRSANMVLDAVDDLTRASIALINAHHDRVLSSFALAREIGALDEGAVRNAVAMGAIGLPGQLQALQIPAGLKFQPKPLALPVPQATAPARRESEDWDIRTF